MTYDQLFAAVRTLANGRAFSVACKRSDSGDDRGATETWVLVIRGVGVAIETSPERALAELRWWKSDADALPCAPSEYFEDEGLRDG